MGSMQRVQCSGFYAAGSMLLFLCSGFYASGSMQRVLCSGFLDFAFKTHIFHIFHYFIVDSISVQLYICQRSRAQIGADETRDKEVTEESGISVCHVLSWLHFCIWSKEKNNIANFCIVARMRSGLERCFAVDKNGVNNPYMCEDNI